MKTKEEVQKEIKELEDKIKPLQEQLNTIYQKESSDVFAKIERCEQMKDKFELSELRFSAIARCFCGAGMAYPKNQNMGLKGFWSCSDILLGRAIRKGQEGAKEHEGRLHFAFYEIKSEEQPSVNGQTTRPKE